MSERPGGAGQAVAEPGPASGDAGPIIRNGDGTDAPYPVKQWEQLALFGWGEGE